MAYKKWKVTVTEKDAANKDEAIQETVWLVAAQKVKAERIAILFTADKHRAKTSDLEATKTEQMKKNDKLDLKQYAPLAGVQKEEFWDGENVV